MTTPVAIVQAADRLGEGPMWSPLDGRLYWFDIKGAKLNWHEPASRRDGRFDLPVRASAAVPRASGGLVLATEAGLALFDPPTGRFELWRPMDLGEGFRSNDGVMGLDGAFWWSSMDDDGGRRPGKYFRTTPDGETQVAAEGIHIPNSLAMTPDGQRLYYADTRRQTIWRADPADLSRREIFVDARGRPGGPDGSAVDAEGFLWNAHWGEWRVIRYAPDGTIDRIIEVPVEQPSCCCFGGAERTTLYITSAWDELSAEARQRQPLAGALFACEPGVKGLALPLFEG
jgi:sugar lactone lactonase YvrE